MAIYRDEGISGTKGRDKRPGLDALLKGVARREFDIVAAWSVCRLGRSLSDLIELLGEQTTVCPRSLVETRTYNAARLVAVAIAEASHGIRAGRQAKLTKPPTGGGGRRREGDYVLLKCSWRLSGECETNPSSNSRR